MFGVEVDLEGNQIDPGYQVVFRASKFSKSLARWLVMQVARCRTLPTRPNKTVRLFDLSKAYQKSTTRSLLRPKWCCQACGLISQETGAVDKASDFVNFECSILKVQVFKTRWPSLMK